MKTWLAKFKISAALDRGEPLPVSPERQTDAGDELGRFAAQCEALVRALRASRPEPTAPPSLHRAVMRAVRTAAHLGQDAQATKRGPGASPVSWPGRLARALPPPWRWAPAAAAAAVVLTLVLGGGWLTRRQPAPPPATADQALSVPGAALEWSAEMSRTVPAAVVAPLSDELERVNRDLENTAEFLLASLPY